jgi:hypothetical protein
MVPESMKEPIFNLDASNNLHQTTNLALLCYRYDVGRLEVGSWIPHHLDDGPRRNRAIFLTSDGSLPDAPKT